MAIPLMVNGILPGGTYLATLPDVWSTFDYASSTTRPLLNAALQHAMTMIWSQDASALIYVDGSYVTSKIDPADVDLAIRSDVWTDLAFEQAFKSAYPGEEILVDAFFNAKQSPQHMEDLFRSVQGSNAPKGIIELKP